MLNKSLYVHKRATLSDPVSRKFIRSVIAASSVCIICGYAIPEPAYSQFADTAAANDTECAVRLDSSRAEWEREIFILSQQLRYQQQFIRALAQELQRGNVIVSKELDYPLQLIGALEHEADGLHSPEANLTQLPALAESETAYESLLWVKPVIWQVAVSTAWSVFKDVLARKKLPGPRAAGT